MMLVGTFVETAFTVEEVERAIAEEKRLGINDVLCVFLGNVLIDAVTIP